MKNEKKYPSWYGMTNREKLELRIEALEIETKGFQFLSDTIPLYKKTTINKYFRDFIEETSEKYKTDWSIYNSTTRLYEQVENILPVYSVHIDTKYINITDWQKITLRINDIGKDYKIQGTEDKIDFIFYYDNPFTLEEFLKMTKAKLDHMKEMIEKIKNDLSKLDEISKEYKETKDRETKLFDSINFYTRDIITDKGSYQIYKN